MAGTGWQRSFEDPIALPDGREHVTLRDAARYNEALPPKVCAQEHWQTAIEIIAIRKALHHGREPPRPMPRGTTSTVRRKAALRPWISCHRPATYAMFHLPEQYFRLHSSKSVRQPRSQPGLEVLSLH
ncbi:hypothetical protein ACE10Z_09845 [Bradyrhizobium sp. Pha-3]|uniref:hypothetical protein n=1 Tax=Bradyrhizobium sp. Pha-3 TaxID=208375 RepID=UPI0035D464A8